MEILLSTVIGFLIVSMYATYKMVEENRKLVERSLELAQENTMLRMKIRALTNGDIRRNNFR